MTKSSVSVPIPDVLPTSPFNLVCPFCKAKPRHDCLTTSGGVAAVHVTRIAAAALINANKRKNGMR